MKKCIKALFVLAIFCHIVSCDSFAEATAKDDKFTLQVKDKLIDLQAENTSFKEILKQLEGKTGIKVKIFEGVKDKEVSLNVKSLPVYALGAILEKMSLKNFAVVYDDQLASVAIYVLPEGKDISRFTKGKSIIRHGNFPSGKTTDTIKDRKIVSITKGENKISIRYVKDEVLLKFHLGVSKQEIQEILKNHNLVEVSEGTLSKIGYIKVRIPDGRDVVSVIKEIRKEYKLKIPEPNYISNVLTVSDPLFSYQWYIPDINFDKAWEKAKSKDTIKVAVIDSGVDAAHPDLKGKISDGFNFVNDDTDASDDHGHGTFVAGIIAATANDIGIKGLYDHAQIIPVKVIDENGLGTYEDVAEGILYAADNGVKVINLSIGGYGYSFMLQEAVDYALEKGCIVVAAGGNDGIEQEIYPAAYPDVIGVSALGYDGEIWPDSNSGRHIDVSAPGVNIISTGLGRSYVYASGTSASASMVSALATMLVSEKPDLSSSLIERLIIQSAKDLGEKGWDKVYGRGEIDAHGALEQEVEPFHDVGVRTVRMEPMVFEKGKPTYVVANIENTGTHKSEKCDVFLDEIIGEEKKKIGTKKDVAVIDKLKVIFDWKPEKIEESIKFEISVYSEDDTNSKNNSKATHIFKIKEEDGLYILYAVEPPVHQWIALQAYNKLPSGPLKDEIINYLPTSSSSTYYSNNFSPPSGWDSNNNAHYTSSTALIEGAWEEDNDDYGIADPIWPISSVFPDDSACRHFWDPEGGYNNGFLGDNWWETEACSDSRNVSSITQAQSWWKEAIEAYPDTLSYYYLGRVAHLLKDMSVPEHGHGDAHFGSHWEGILDVGYPSALEEYTKTDENYKDISAGDSGTNIPDIDSLPAFPGYTPSDFDDDLTKLFYNLVEYADDFDGNHTSGEGSEFGHGKFRFARNQLDANKSVDRVELWDSTIFGNPDFKIRDLARYYEYDYYNNSCENRIYYYGTLYDEIDNTDDGVRVYYTDGTDDYFYNLDEHDLLDPWDEPAECIYQPNLQAKAIGYVAALYHLFWEETHPPDTTPPTITITSPTSSSTYTTSSSSLNIGGTASDNVGVTQVTWSNSSGGSGTASGTTSWSVSGITLQSGSNVITVTAKDAANNTGTDTLAVTYNPPVTTPPVINSISDDSTTEGATYTGPTPSLSQGTLPVTWSLVNGPSGMTINSSTGVVSWTNPTVSGSPHTITIRATNTAGYDDVSWQLTVTLENEPDISVSPPSHDFGDVLVGDLAEQVFMVSNNGNDTLHVTGFSIMGDHPDDFSIVSGDVSFDLNPQDTHDITVRFSPTSTGTKNAILRILSDDPDDPQKDASLTGYGETSDYYVAPAPLGDDNSNTGVAPASPFATVQHAIAVAQGSETVSVTIHVAVGTYTENVVMDNWESLEGGWNSDFSQRWDFINDGIEPTIDYETVIDGNGFGRCITLNSLNNVVVDGFKIYNGNASYGGGIYIYSSSPIIRNCIFAENSGTTYGGGIYIENSASSPQIIKCIIKENNSANGAGIFSVSESSPTIADCIIEDNNATYWGGGIYCGSSTYSTLSNCIISRNMAGTDDYFGGGGIAIFTSNINLNNCVIKENFSDYGGGISSRGSSASANLTNCTFTGNSGKYGGAISQIEGAMVITNSIFWNNRADSGEEIRNRNAILNIGFSNISGGIQGIVNIGGSVIDNGGNTDLDPLFVDPDGSDDTLGNEDDNFRLGYGSPCVNSGTDGVNPDGFTDMGAFPAVTVGTTDWSGRTCDFSSIQDGINDIDSSNRTGSVLVNPGTYIENIILEPYVDMIGAGINSTVIDGGGSGSVIIAKENNYIRGFTIRNGGHIGDDSGIGSGTKVTLTNNKIFDVRYGIWVSGTNNVISNNLILIGDDSGIVIGIISSFAPALYPLIQNNTMDGLSKTGSTGIVCVSSGSSPTIINNIISNFGSQGIYVQSYDDPAKIKYNCFWNNTQDFVGIPDQVGVNGNFSGDPLYVDPGIEDYHLQNESPAVDAGDPVEKLTADCTAGVVLEVDSVTAISAGDTIWITDNVNAESDEVVDTTNTNITVANGFTNSYLVADGAYVYTKSSDYYSEPEPNGGRINMGAFGGTTEAAQTISAPSPSIVDYTVDYTNDAIDITYSKPNMQNANIEANYSFSPTLYFLTTGGSDDITYIGSNTYRLFMSSIPDYTIFTLTVSNITDEAGKQVAPSSITINDNDNDNMADDWETFWGIDDPVLDQDGDNLTNLQEYNYYISDGWNLNPKSDDTDTDDLPDGWEISNGLDPTDDTGNNGRDGDFDTDGWTNYEEYINGTNPNDDTDPVPTPPEIGEVTPHHNAGITDNTRVPNNTSFAVRIEDSDGIDTTDLESITFTIDDNDNVPYEYNLGNTTVVRVVKLDSTQDDDHVTKLWAIYDRSKDDTYGNVYPFGATATISVDAKDKHQDWMDQGVYCFKIETQQQHEDAEANLPPIEAVDPNDPDLEGSYDAGIEVNSGNLEGAKIIYESSEPMTPTLGPIDELPSFDVNDAEAIGVPMNLQPPTVFNAPVKIFIPCPGYTDVSNLSVYLYNGTSWVLACDASGNVKSGAEEWMKPGSRENHNNGSPSTIEIQVYHFTGVQAASTNPPIPPTPSGGGGGGGCFIATAAFGTPMEPHVKVLRDFRDRFMINNGVGKAFVDLYSTYSPPVADFIASHDTVRLVVRWSLMSVVGMSWMALNIGLIPTLTIILLMLIFINISVVVLFRRIRMGTHMA